MLKLFNFKKKKKIILKAPFKGQVVNLVDVPDKAFAQKMVGDGVALKPKDTYLLAPVAGEIIQLFPTYHALGIKTAEGLEVLIHLGIDTVELKGEGFTPLVKKNQKVTPGERLIKIDWPSISNKVPSTISPIIITNMEMVKKIDVLAEGEVKPGEDLLSVII